LQQCPLWGLKWLAWLLLSSEEEKLDSKVQAVRQLCFGEVPITTSSEVSLSGSDFQFSDKCDSFIVSLNSSIGPVRWKTKAPFSPGGQAYTEIVRSPGPNDRYSPSNQDSYERPAVVSIVAVEAQVGCRMAWISLDQETHLNLHWWSLSSNWSAGLNLGLSSDTPPD
jgi:hypothetical protein